MNRFGEVAQVAVVADPAHLSGSRQRLLDALSQSTLPDFRVDLPGAGLPGAGLPVGARHDLIHLIGGVDPSGTVAVAGEHGIDLVASYPVAPFVMAPSDCRLILSPSAAADAELLAGGARPAQLARWQPGVDTESFGPGHYARDLLSRDAERIHVLHVGTPRQAQLLHDAFTAAAEIEPRLSLLIVEDEEDLPRLYASADLLLHSGISADFPLEILEAQASGLPVLALDAGAARELIEDGRNGVLVPPVPRAIAEALVSLARRATLRERLTVGGLNSIRVRTWERSLQELTAAWTLALMPYSAPIMRAA